jgi:hypothetical protein
MLEIYFPSILFHEIICQHPQSTLYNLQIATIFFFTSGVQKWEGDGARKHLLITKVS